MSDNREGSRVPENIPDQEEIFERKVVTAHQYGELHDKRGMPQVYSTPREALVAPGFGTPPQFIPVKLPALNVPWEAEVHLFVTQKMLIYGVGNPPLSIQDPLMVRISQTEQLPKRDSVEVTFQGLEDGELVEFKIPVIGFCPPGGSVPVLFPGADGFKLLSASQLVQAGAAMRFGPSGILFDPYLPVNPITLGAVLSQAAIVPASEVYNGQLWQISAHQTQVTFATEQVFRYMHKKTTYKGNEDRFYVSIISPGFAEEYAGYVYAVVRAI